MKKYSIGFISALVLTTLVFLSPACASKSSKPASSTESPIAQKSEIKESFKIPERAFKGEAFLIEISTPYLEKASIFWQGKTIEIKADKNREIPTASTLLSVGLGEKKSKDNLKISLHEKFGSSKARGEMAEDIAKESTSELNKEVSREITREIRFLSKEYPVQRLTVAPRYVSPPASVQDKIKRDRQEMREALAVLSTEKMWTLPFIRPVPGPITSEYGLRREFNGQKRNPHRGLDLDGEKGDPILAAEKGRVVLVSDHYYGGNTVVLDHGLGIFTIYLHMDSFAVQKSQKVERGEILGTVGSTGRVTGPHLHLSFSVLGQSVNPSPVLEAYPDYNSSSGTGSGPNPDSVSGAGSNIGSGDSPKR